MQNREQTQPRLVIDLIKLRRNIEAAGRLCHERGIGIAAVTKLFCADPRIVETLLSRPVEYLADSRLKNIEKYPIVNVPRILLRSPLPGEAQAVVKGCDISLNSELVTLRALGNAAGIEQIRHGVILMIDMGDLREGLYWENTEEILRTAEYISAQPWLELTGIGVNLTCYGSVIPDKPIMERFAEIAVRLQSRLQMKLKIVSGGNSSAIDLLEKGEMPAEINNLRLGEFLIRGQETAFQQIKPYMEADSVCLEAALVEVQEKPSYPAGTIGLNAFGEKSRFIDKGRRRRGILNIGRQDVDYAGMKCLEPGVEILGASSDHLLVDLTEAEQRQEIGDPLRFSLNYAAMLRAFTSPYVTRTYMAP